MEKGQFFTNHYQSTSCPCWNETNQTGLMLDRTFREHRVPSRILRWIIQQFLDVSRSTMGSFSQ
jgi:hypothetical protein